MDAKYPFKANADVPVIMITTRTVTRATLERISDDRIRDCLSIKFLRNENPRRKRENNGAQPNGVWQIDGRDLPTQQHNRTQ